MLHNCFSNNLVKKNRNYKCNTHRIRSQFALGLTIKTQGVECCRYRVTEDRFLELEKIIHYRCPTVRSRVVISISLSYDPIKLMLMLIFRSFSRDESSMAGTFIDNGFHHGLDKCLIFLSTLYTTPYKRNVANFFQFPFEVMQSDWKRLNFTGRFNSLH